MALSGVGVQDGPTFQWEEWTGRAYHVRRLLTPEEQRITGPVEDVRGTHEAIERIEKALKANPRLPRAWAMQEARK